MAKPHVVLGDGVVQEDHQEQIPLFIYENEGKKPWQHISPTCHAEATEIQRNPLHYPHSRIMQRFNWWF